MEEDPSVQTGELHNDGSEKSKEKKKKKRIAGFISSKLSKWLPESKREKTEDAPKDSDRKEVSELGVREKIAAFLSREVKLAWLPKSEEQESEGAAEPKEPSDNKVVLLARKVLETIRDPFGWEEGEEEPEFSQKPEDKAVESVATITETEDNVGYGSSPITPPVEKPTETPKSKESGSAFSFGRKADSSRKLKKDLRRTSEELKEVAQDVEDLERENDNLGKKLRDLSAKVMTIRKVSEMPTPLPPTEPRKETIREQKIEQIINPPEEKEVISKKANASPEIKQVEPEVKPSEEKPVKAESQPAQRIEKPVETESKHSQMRTPEQTQPTIEQKETMINTEKKEKGRAATIGTLFGGNVRAVATKKTVAQEPRKETNKENRFVSAEYETIVLIGLAILATAAFVLLAKVIIN